MVDGVMFSSAEAARALSFINQSPASDLRASGMVSRSVGIVLQQRPFDSMKAFGDTPYIGPKTLEAVARTVRK
jgi:hypothetical protein